MPRLSTTVPNETNAWIEKQVGDRFDSKSEAVRHHLSNAKKLDKLDYPLEYYIERANEADNLEKELEIMEAKRDDLRRQLQERNKRIREMRDQHLLARIRNFLR